MENNKSLNKDIVTGVVTAFKLGGIAVSGVSKLGAYALINGAANYALDKMGFSGFKRFASKVFVNTSLMTFVNDKVCNYAFNDYIDTVDTAEKTVLKVLCPDDEEEKADDADAPFDTKGEDEDADELQ